MLKDNLKEKRLISLYKSLNLITKRQGFGSVSCSRTLELLAGASGELWQGVWVHIGMLCQKSPVKDHFLQFENIMTFRLNHETHFQLTFVYPEFMN